MGYQVGGISVQKIFLEFIRVAQQLHRQQEPRPQQDPLFIGSLFPRSQEPRLQQELPAARACSTGKRSSGAYSPGIYFRNICGAAPDPDPRRRSRSVSAYQLHCLSQCVSWLAVLFPYRVAARWSLFQAPWPALCVNGRPPACLPANAS